MDSNYVRILTDEEAMHALEDAVKHGRALPFEAAERLLNGMGTFTPAPLSPDVEAAEKAWGLFWEKRKLPDEAFIAPGYVVADDIAAFADEYARAVRAPRPTATPALADAWHRILNTDASPDEFVRVSCDDVSTVLCALQNAYNGTAESVPRLTGEQREAQLLLSHATAGKEDFETVKVTAGVLRAAFAADLAGEVDRG